MPNLNYTLAYMMYTKNDLILNNSFTSLNTDKNF